MTQVRAAAPEDLDVILELDRRCFPRPWTAQAWALELADGALWVAGTPIAGFACASVVLDRCELRRIAVDPGQRRRGLGRDLLVAVMQRARERGCTVLELEVAAQNAAARTLYEGLGFRQVGRRPGYYRQPPDDALLFDKLLVSG